MRNRLGTIFIGTLSAITLTLTVASALPATAAPAYPPGHHNTHGGSVIVEHSQRAGCTWTTTWTMGGGGNPPGWGQIQVNSESPSGCEQFRPNITASDLQCPPGQGHCRFTGGWVKQGISYVNTCGGPITSCPGVDGATLNTAYLDRRPTGSSSYQCKNEETDGPWRTCTAN